MKAAVLEAVNRVVVREVPEPVAGDYQALCEIAYGSVCAGTDNHLVKGSKPFSDWFTMPAILGHESIGRVVKLGPKVRHLRVGDLVTRVGTPPVGDFNVAWGGFAELGIATDWKALREDGASEAQIGPYLVQQVLPSGSDPRAATLFITWRETWSFLTRLGLRPGQRLGIVGSGGNAFSFAAHARNLGCQVTILGNPGRSDLATASALISSITAPLTQPINSALTRVLVFMS
jgi:D-arabinose 1-dehydrogenase-like Zn-dependent alcohol dehydrogenase